VGAFLTSLCCKGSSEHDANDVLHAAVFAPPTVSVTKAKFTNGYRKPIASLYNTVLQELLVQQHFIRYSIKYQYNEVRYVQ
jgi:hypothetical protein